MRRAHTIRTAFRALRSNVLRSTLTALGIIIGIAAVIAMVEIGRGSTTAVRRTIEGLGANVIQIDPSDAVKAGQVVKVKVLSADTQRKRIGLSIKEAEQGAQ